MTAAELRKILLSADFTTGLEELSSYLASIAQERPIVHLIAKCLWNQKRLFALERNKRHDLTVWTPAVPSGNDETSIEFKFNYETCEVKLREELGSLREKLGGNAPKKEKKNSNWDVLPRIWRDVFEKQSDMFVWIICSRDLNGIHEDDLKRTVNWWKPLKKYRLTHAYKTDREFLVTIDAFLNILQQILHEVRQFSVLTAEIETKGHFPSTYHFRICEFARPSSSAGASPSRKPVRRKA
jgi:hypothetical protein